MLRCTEEKPGDGGVEGAVTAVRGLRIMAVRFPRAGVMKAGLPQGVLVLNSFQSRVASSLGHRVLGP
jgi:hypothetical protein